MNRREKEQAQVALSVEQYEKKIYDLKQLIEIGKGLNSTLDYNTLIDSILFTCMGHMQLTRAGIFLSRGISFEDLTLHRNYKGFEVDHTREYELKKNSPLLCHIQKSVRCYTNVELQDSVIDEKSLTVLSLLEPDLVVPLVSKGEINGIIILADRIREKEFSDSEKEFLLDIASLAGIAINNALLYEMATTDMMTRLKIHHYFQTAVAEEIEKSVKFERPLSLIMMDIDDFKKFNDTYGHTAGDDIIKNVSRTIRENIRPMDIAARYGGEEFAVILPKTDINESLIVSERIRQSVDRQILPMEGEKVHVTISLGLTQYQVGLDEKKNDFINRADQALYRSKRNGKNRVTFL